MGLRKDKERKTQWHPAFCSAMRLELKGYEAYLDYINEYNLNSKPLELDLLIIKLVKDIKIENEIGRIFRTHNIVEYKSPDDAMNEGTFLKVYGYACLYKAQEEYVNAVPLEEISLTLVRKRYPRKLFGWLRAHSYDVVEQYPGIYYVFRKDDFPIQIIVSKRLSKKNQKWLTLLDGGLSKSDAQRAIAQTNELEHGYERAYADSVLQVALKENEEVFDELKKEDAKMYEWVREWLKPEINEEKEKKTKEVEEKLTKEVTEAVTKEVTEAVTKEVTEAVTKEVTEAVTKTATKEAIKATRNEVILRCLKKGYDIETISDISGVTIQEVEAIAQKEK